MSAAAVSAYRDLVYGDPGVGPLFRAGDAALRDFPIADRFSPREAARNSPHRRSSRNSLGVRLDAVAGFCFPAGTASGRGSSAAGKHLARSFCRPWIGNGHFSPPPSPMRRWRSPSRISISPSGMRVSSTMQISGLESGSRFRTNIERSTREILRLTGQNRLLDREPVLRRSIDRRNPYVDPISFVQVELLRRLRGGSRSGLDAARHLAHGQRNRRRSQEHRLVLNTKQPRDRSIPRSTCMRLAIPSHDGRAAAASTGRTAEGGRQHLAGGRHRRKRIDGDVIDVVATNSPGSANCSPRSTDVVNTLGFQVRVHVALDDLDRRPLGRQTCTC